MAREGQTNFIHCKSIELCKQEGLLWNVSAMTDDRKTVVLLGHAVIEGADESCFIIIFITGI
jgi:hypothetical protein